MLIPKGRTISWSGVTYRPGQKVAPAHKAKVRELLLRVGNAPIEEEGEVAVEREPMVIEDTNEPLPSVPPVNLLSEEEPEEKPKKARRKSKKEMDVDPI